MTECQKEKYELVKNYLSPLLKRLGLGVVSAEYCVGAKINAAQELIPAIGGEYVAIKFKHGKFESVEYKDVTADSLVALCRDTLKGL